MSFKSQTGFTLVELMIVVVIVVILAGVGYPLYQDQVRKARRADAKSAAMQVALAEEQFFTRTGSYTSDLSAGSLNLDRGLENGDSEGGYYDIAVTATSTSFTVAVTPTAGKSQTRDDDCQSFTVDQTGRKTAKDKSNNVATKCW